MRSLYHSKTNYNSPLIKRFDLTCLNITPLRNNRMIIVLHYGTTFYHVRYISALDARDHLATVTPGKAYSSCMSRSPDSSLLIRRFFGQFPIFEQPIQSHIAGKCGKQKGIIHGITKQDTRFTKDTFEASSQWLKSFMVLISTLRP